MIKIVNSNRCLHCNKKISEFNEEQFIDQYKSDCKCGEESA